MIMAFLSLIAYTIQLAMVIASVFAAYAIAAIFLGLCVLTMRKLAELSRRAVTKVLSFSSIRRRVQIRREFVRRYKEEKNKTILDLNIIIPTDTELSGAV